MSEVHQEGVDWPLFVRMRGFILIQSISCINKRKKTCQLRQVFFHIYIYQSPTVPYEEYDDGDGMKICSTFRDKISLIFKIIQIMSKLIHPSGRVIRCDGYILSGNFGSRRGRGPTSVGRIARQDISITTTKSSVWTDDCNPEFAVECKSLKVRPARVIRPPRPFR